jgi:hypothetical protein
VAGTIPARLTPAQQGRKFGLTVGIAFLVFAGISLWRGHDLAPRILGALGGTLVLAGLLIPALLLPVERGWMRFAHLLSKVTTPIFMGLVYFLVFTPFGIVRRLAGKNALVHKSDAGSYWVTLDRAARARRSMRRQF